MNTIIFQAIYTAIRTGMVLAAGFFVFVNTAFAAPALTPVSVSNLTGESAMITGNVSNPYKNSTVWFEFYNDSGSTVALATQGIWHDGMFTWYLRDLTPGKTYSVRSAAMEDGVTVYSPTSSFTTPLPKSFTTSTVANQTQAPAIVQGETQTATVKQTPAVKKTQTVSTTNATPKKTEKSVAVKATTSEGFTNGSVASIIGAGDGMLPSTLIGWVALLIAILVVVLIGRTIYDSAEKRREERERKDKEREDEEGEKK